MVIANTNSTLKGHLHQAGALSPSPLTTSTVRGAQYKYEVSAVPELVLFMENITFEDMCGKNMLMTLGVGWADQSGTLYRALFVSSEKGKIIALTTRSFANKTVSFSLDGKRYTTFERQGKITLYGKTFYQFLVKDREGKRMTLHWFLSQSPARIVDALPDEVFFSGQRVRV